MIEVVAIPDLDIDLSCYRGILFTSPKSVEIFCSSRVIPSSLSIYSLGKGTSKVLSKFGYTPDFTSDIAYSEESFRSLHKIYKGSGSRILFPTGDKTRETPTYLAEDEVFVDRVITYENRGVECLPDDTQSKIDKNFFDMVIFTSGSGVESFFNLVSSINTDFAVIGKKCEKVLNQFGYSGSVMPENPDIERLAELIREFYLFR
jgi:uroporphyrinogen-III synthase